jgi:3-dehydroquinate dehydratase/shikimate dehydrogenase
VKVVPEGGEGMGEDQEAVRGRASMIATLTAPLTPESAADLAGVDWLEVRADLLGDVDPEPLRRQFGGKLLYTLRSRAEGGAYDGSAERRRRRLVEAAARFDRVDLEAARDLRVEVLDAVPAERRIVSWHGPAADLAALEACFARMTAADAALYKLVPTASQPGEELAPLLFLHRLERTDVIAFAGGPAGFWTRLIAPRLGAPVVYGAAGDLPGAPGQPSIATLRDDYGLPDLPPISALFGIVGDPVAHSLSPRLHNAAYRELGIPALYLPFQAASFGDFWLEVVEGGVLEEIGLPIHGLSITAPHKAAALAVAGAESPLATLIGAANTLVLRDSVWEAESTDPEGVVIPLRQRGLDLTHRRAAILGAGGAGRAAAVGLARAGAAVTLFNRSPERATQAAEALGLPCLPLADLVPGDFDLLVNATPLGQGYAVPPASAAAAGAAAAAERTGGTTTGGASGAAASARAAAAAGAAEAAAGVSPEAPLPFAVDALRPGAIIIDLVYRHPAAGPTPLLAAAAAQGAVTIDGREVLLGQAHSQFRLMTGRDLPLATARRLLGLPP